QSSKGARHKQQNSYR
ncbi:MAG: hypothetical protein ABEJ66_02870, partial [Candidatus Nanohaloarchaea archaeon]